MSQLALVHPLIFKKKRKEKKNNIQNKRKEKKNNIQNKRKEKKRKRKRK